MLSFTTIIFTKPPNSCDTSMQNMHPYSLFHRIPKPTVPNMTLELSATFIIARQSQAGLSPPPITPTCGADAVPVARKPS